MKSIAAWNHVKYNSSFNARYWESLEEHYRHVNVDIIKNY